jgi:hypothetical protein
MSNETGKQSNTVIYRYSTILSYVMERWLDDRRTELVEHDGKIFLFSDTYPTKYIYTVFTDYIEEFFRKQDVTEYGLLNTIVIGSCYPHNNWRSDDRTNIKGKRLDILKKRMGIRYILSDRLYYCNEEMLNGMFDSIIIDYMTKENTVITNNFDPVKWISLRTFSEDDLLLVAMQKHHDAVVIDKFETDIILDLNHVVFEHDEQVLPLSLWIQASGVYDFMIFNEEPPKNDTDD